MVGEGHVSRLQRINTKVYYLYLWPDLSHRARSGMLYERFRHSMSQLSKTCPVVKSDYVTSGTSSLRVPFSV